MIRLNLHKLPLRISLLAFCAAILAAAAAIGQTGGSNGNNYSYAALDTFWRNTVGAQTLSVLTTSAINSAVSNLPALASTSGSGGGRRGRLPPSGGGTTTTVGSPDQSFYFDWQLPASPQLDLEMVQREVTLSTFLTMADNYRAADVTAPSNDPSAYQQAANAVAAQTQTVQLRRYSAQIELFLIMSMRYYQADTIADKCERLKVMQRLLAQLDVVGLADTPGGSGAPALADSRFAALQSTVNNFVSRAVTVDGQQVSFRSQIGTAVACLVTEVSSRDEDLAKAAAAMDQDIIADLTKSDPQHPTLQDSLTAINAQLAQWEALRNDLSLLDPKAKELLDLELGVANARDNFHMVSADMLGAQAAFQAMIAELKKDGIMNAAGQYTGTGVITNLSAVLADSDAGVKTLGPLATLDAKLVSLQSALNDYVSALRTLPERLPAPYSNATLAVCHNIPADYAANGGDPAPIADCIGALNAIVAGAGGTSGAQKQMAAFGLSAQEMTRLIVCQRKGIAPPSCPAN